MGDTLRRVQNCLLRIAGFVVIVADLTMAVLLGIEVYYACASEEWPSTLGRITENHRTIEEGTEHVHARRGSGGGHYSRKVTFLQEHFEYSYVVDGREYRNHRIAFVGCEGDKRHAIKLRNDEVPVFYNPRSPSQSVLVPGLRVNIWPLAILGLMGLAFGTMLVIGGVEVFEWPFRWWRLLRGRR